MNIRQKSILLALILLPFVLHPQIAYSKLNKDGTNEIAYFTYSHTYLDYWTGDVLLEAKFYENKDVQVTYKILRQVENGGTSGPFENEFDVLLKNSIDDWNNFTRLITNINSWETISTNEGVCDGGFVKKLQVQYENDTSREIVVQQGSSSCSQIKVEPVDENVNLAFDNYENYLLRLIEEKNSSSSFIKPNSIPGFSIVSIFLSLLILLTIYLKIRK